MLNPDGPDTQISRHLKIDFWKCHKTQTAFSSSQANVGMNPCKPIGNKPVGHEPIGNEPEGHDPEGNEPVGHEPEGDDQDKSREATIQQVTNQ